MADVFISYSRRDSGFVARLTEELRSRGKDVWVDVEGIRDAEVFPVALRRAIEGSDAFLFVISPDAVASAFCEQEVAHAAELNKRIVPLVLRPVPDAELPEEVRFRNWIPADEGNAVAERVVAAIETDLEWERQHTQVTVRALQWDQAGRDGSMLLRGSELAAAERWLAAGAGKDPGPTVLEQEYLLAGRQAAARRQRNLIGAFSAMLVVAVGLLIFALISRGQAVGAETSAKAQDLAAESQVQQTVDPELAVLLGMAAVQTKVTYGEAGTMFALRAALDASPIRYRLPDAATQGCPGGVDVAYDPAPHAGVLVEGLCSGELVFADAGTGRVMRTARLPGGGDIDLEYTANGSSLIVWTGQELLALDPVTGAVQRRAPLRARFLVGFAVDPHAPVVAVATRNRLDYWNLSTGRLTVTDPRALEAIPGLSWVTYSPDGRELAITFDAGFSSPTPGMVLYDVATQRIVASARTPGVGASFSPDGRELAVAEDAPTGGSIVMLRTHGLTPVRGFVPFRVAGVEPSALAFSPDGSELAYGFFDGTAGLMSATSGRLIVAYLGDTASIAWIGFSPNGALVVTGAGDGTARAWRGSGLAELQVPVGDTNGQVLTDGDGFEALGDPGLGPKPDVVVQRYTDDGRAAAAPLALAATPNIDAAFLSTGGRFAGEIPAGPADALTSAGTLRVWNVDTRRVIRTIHLPVVPSGYEPVMSQDGRYVVMSVPSPSSPTAPPNLVLVDTQTGHERVLARGTPACTSSWTGFAFSQDDRLVAAGTFCGIESVWDVATGRKVGQSLALDGQVSAAAFSPDDRQLAVASWDGKIDVTPIPIALKRVTVLTENTKGVPLVSYSPNGRYLASAGLDATVRIFDAHTLMELRVITQPGPTAGVAFTADSLRVLGYTSPGTASLWDACTDCESPQALLALARGRVTRQLTTAERREFGVG
jgi:WD40 repeat protein